ncbi:latent-transforming growth factor beta-binding protein 2-like [Montipora capricornis]|uniref:latent-transforming growth factor beta-binding protein 2-like n=1 Tax=Montipora capricornis TaxID=246305 RepID=UPI0035F1FA35
MNGYCVCEDGPGNGAHCRKRFDLCYPVDPCGFNNHCATDLLTGDLWCICRIGVDKDGNCVECFTDGHCAHHKARCVNHRCECFDEMYRSEGRCTNWGVKPKMCVGDRNCHPDAKCIDGNCICQGRRLGDGVYCRKGLDCMDWQKDSCGPRGICLRDPYLNHLRDCKCFPGHYYLAHIAECVECKTNEECGVSGYCQHFLCKCKDELIKKGFTKTCLPAPLQKCKSHKECHEKAKCFMGKCICQNNFTGNGKFCREGELCSKEQVEQCGPNSKCISDPIIPDKPVCRCLKGYRMFNGSKCVDVDECKTLRAKCKVSRCVNTVGSYACTNCKHGFIDGVHGECVAMDECGGCGENEECYEGECYCADGYDFNALGQCFLPDEDSLLSNGRANPRFAQRFLSCLWMFFLESLVH